MLFIQVKSIEHDATFTSVVIVNQVLDEGRRQKRIQVFLKPIIG